MQEQRVPNPKTEWEAYKAWSRGIAELVKNRATPTPAPYDGYQRPDTSPCRRTKKHRNAAGVCRRDCDCRA